MKTGKLRQAVIYIAFLLISVSAMAEVALRALDVKAEFDGYGTTGVYLDPELLYELVPGRFVQINSYGFRNNPIHPKAGGVRRVLFLGDSFVFGIGGEITPSTTLPKLLERELGGNVEVINMGIYGYGPDQSLAQLRRYGPALKPDMVVLGVFAANDFNDLFKNRMYTIGNDGVFRENPQNIVTSEMGPSRLVFQLRYLAHKFTTKSSDLNISIRTGSFSELFRQLFDDSLDIETYKSPEGAGAQYRAALMNGVMGQYVKTTGELGATFMVAVIPSYASLEDDATLRKINLPVDLYFAGEDRMEEICRAQGIPVINLYKGVTGRQHPAPLFSPWDDYHLSVYGNRFMGRLIGDFIKNTPALLSSVQR